jgi:predicted extracellular nuclease
VVKTIVNFTEASSYTETEIVTLHQNRTYMLQRFIFLFSLVLVSNLQAQTRTIAFYNVENLFDTLDHPVKNDNEFLPDGSYEWTSERYQSKLVHINQVIDSLQVPMILGLCEIENKEVVQDLVNAGSMKETHDIVHFESLDQRGIDNAIVYDKTLLKLEESGILRFDMPEPFSPSRDIVWAKFSRGKDTILAMVNHWPSRRGGQVESEPKRMVAAIAASEFIDSVLNTNKKINLVFMGDLNDYPDNRTVQMVSDLLKPMIVKSSGKYGGSHNYRGEWHILDHMMVSKSFLKKKTKVKKKTAEIYTRDFLLTEYKGNIVPKRNYGGRKYLGGYSDHMPIVIQVKMK